MKGTLIYPWAIPPHMDNFEYAHAHRDEIVWMSQNTNQLAPREVFDRGVRHAIEARAYELYPPAMGTPELRECVASDLGTRSSVLITNGGIEAGYIATRALLAPGDEVISCDPSFMPIHHQIELSGARCIEVPIYEGGCRIDPESVIARISERTRMLLLIDPLNPLGTGYARDEVRALAEICSDNDLLLMHDVTYRDFAFEHTSAEEFIPDRTVTIYSFSKSCGIAGMRIGALVAPGPLMERMLRFNTNVLGTSMVSQCAALELLRTKGDWMEGMLARARANQERIKKAVETRGDISLPVYPSNANMFLIDISRTGLDPDELETYLLRKKGVFIRSGRYVSRRFGERFIRVSFTVPEEGCMRFVESLPEAIDSLLSRSLAGTG